MAENRKIGREFKPDAGIMPRKIEISFARSMKPTGAVAVFPVTEGADPTATAGDIGPAETLAKLHTA